jgi:hypothetical protein
MTLIIQKPTGAKLVMAKNYPADDDSRAYIAAVEAADGQSLESGVKMAIDAFVLGCKADGIWLAIKASCILAGARTLAGALVPLVGTAPTRFGTEGGWIYDRKTGLRGNGTNNYLNTNRANNADPQNSSHIALYLSTLPSGNVHFIGVNAGNRTRLGNNGNHFSNSRNVATDILSNSGLGLGFLGNSRNVSNSYIARWSGSSFNFNTASSAPESLSSYVFGSNNSGPPVALTTAVIPFYSIGESLDLALLDTRVTDLINAFAAAIP